MEKLLISAVADADVTVRHSIFTSLQGDRGFDEYLAQADNLSAVFAALNDEVCRTSLPGTGMMPFGLQILILCCLIFSRLY